jgi:hypothetical protein
MKGKVPNGHVEYYLDKSIVKVLDPNYIPSDQQTKAPHDEIDEDIQ